MLTTAFQPVRSGLMEGQRAVVEQIICAEAAAFIGTRDSTFTFRINEERFDISPPPTLVKHILIIPPVLMNDRSLRGLTDASTYNFLCPKTSDEHGLRGFHCDYNYLHDAAKPFLDQPYVTPIDRGL